MGTVPFVYKMVQFYETYSAGSFIELVKQYGMQHFLPGNSGMKLPSNENTIVPIRLAQIDSTQRGQSLLCTFSFEFSDDTLADACQTADLADACTKMLHLYDHAVPFFLGKVLKGDGTVNAESR